MKFNYLHINQSFLPNDIKYYEDGWKVDKIYGPSKMIFINHAGQLYVNYNNDQDEVEKAIKRDKFIYYGDVVKNFRIKEIRFSQIINGVLYEFDAFFKRGRIFKLIQIKPKSFIIYFENKLMPINNWIYLTFPFALILKGLMSVCLPLNFLITGNWSYKLSQKNKILNWFRSLHLCK